MRRKIVITGGGGFLGVALAAHLLQNDAGVEIVLSDVAQHPRMEPLKGAVAFVTADITKPADCRRLVDDAPDVVYHLASLVSGGAEADFAANLDVNILASINLLEACRKTGRSPRFVFPSSIAVFGGQHLPDEVNDWTHLHPQSSYGVAKAVVEQLLNDYSRKGFIEGRGVRLPAIVVRDEPNTAVSGYASALIRESLAGRRYVCPVAPHTRIPIASVECAVATLAALADLPAQAFEDYRTVNGPNISPSALEIVSAVRAVGTLDVGIVTFEPDAKVASVLATWPKTMKHERAARLGLMPDASIEGIVTAYIAAASKAAI